MDVRIKHTAVLGDRVNTIYIDAPCRGVFYCTAKDFTIVPRVVEEGENEVIALRHGKLMEVVEGEVVGVIIQLDQDEKTRQGRPAKNK